MIITGPQGRESEVDDEADDNYRLGHLRMTIWMENIYRDECHFHISFLNFYDFFRTIMMR